MQLKSEHQKMRDYFLITKVPLKLNLKKHSQIFKKHIKKIKTKSFALQKTSLVQSMDNKLTRTGLW